MLELKPGIDAVVINKTLNTLSGSEFTTFLIKIPRFILAQLNTHRMLVRSVRSSRAIPVKKLIEDVINDPVIPMFTKNIKGMSGSDLDMEANESALTLWNKGKQQAIDLAYELAEQEIHKQTVNRILEPYAHVLALVSGTEWDNFYNLRLGHAAQPEIHDAAKHMFEASQNFKASNNVFHLPFTDKVNESFSNYSFAEQLIIAVARCARLSYNCFDGTFSFEKDKELVKMLLNDKHFSPFEHVAMSVCPSTNKVSSNNRGLQSVANLTAYDGPHLIYTRQYRHFYTLRHMIEDNNLNNMDSLLQYVSKYQIS